MTFVTFSLSFVDIKPQILYNTENTRIILCPYRDTARKADSILCQLI